MTKFNQALIAGASSIALFAGALTLITPSAEAQSWSFSNSGNSTYGYGSNGARYSGQTIGNQHFYNGTDSYGNRYSGSCQRIGNQTFCN